MNFLYGVSHFERDRGSFPALPLINLVTEETTTEESPSLQSRPGLQLQGDEVGSGPVSVLFRSDGVLDGNRFAVSGDKAFEDLIEIGTVTGNGTARIEGFEGFVFFNAGEDVYSYDGAAFIPVVFPDDADVQTICVGASRLVCIRKDSGTIYWSDPLDNVVDGLSFATAESSPDFLRDLLYVGDRLILFGGKTVEIWQPTGDQDLPFQPVIGMVYSSGIRQTGAACEFNGSFAWITEEHEIVLGSPDQPISNPDMNTKIEASAASQLWTFVIDGIEFLCVRLDTKSYIYNSATGLWSEFSSFNKTNWLCRCYVDGIFGSAETGELYEWSAAYDDFGAEHERRFRAWAPIVDGNVTLYSVHMRAAPGLTPYLVGLLANPSAELRISGDGGFTWTSWLPRSLGPSGQYRKTIRWNSLGSYAYPGVLIEVRVTDPVPFRMSGLYANQGGGNV